MRSRLQRSARFATKRLSERLTGAVSVCTGAAGVAFSKPKASSTRCFDWVRDRGVGAGRTRSAAAEDGGSAANRCNGLLRPVWRSEWSGEAARPDN